MTHRFQTHRFQTLRSGYIPALGFCFLLLATCSVFGSNPAKAQNNPVGFGGPRFVPDEVLIQFRPGATAAQQNEARGQAKARSVETIRAGGNGKGRLELASLPPGQTVAEAVRSLKAHSFIAFAEPNWIYTHASIANDLYYTNGSLWGMYGDGTSPVNQFGSQAGEAWSAGNTGSRSIVVGIIDEGIDFNHPDLKANVGNPVEVADGIDNDGNGKIDDVNGWDFASNNNTVYDGGSLDKHGTHVAGTIGGVGGNTSGVVGVNWNVTMVSGKFLGSNGGTLANAVKAVEYFTDLKTNRGVNIVATNNSWGGGGYSQALHDAIIRGAKASILFIAAAGNDGRNNDTTLSYPSSYDTTKGTSTESAASFDAVIAVAALSNDGTKPSWSNYGKTSVDLAAPGNGIYSTLPGNTYGSYSGTSMATPHVTGAAALLASQGVSSAQAIKDAIIQSARNTPTPSMASITATGGRLNLGSTVAPTYGTLSGSVSANATGIAIGGAKVSIGGTTLSATTDAEGAYSISNVPSGTYSVSASAIGYQGQTTNAVTISTGVATANFALNVATQTQMYVAGMTWSRVRRGNTYDVTIVVTVNQDSDGDGLAETSDGRLANTSVTLNVTRDSSSVGTASSVTNLQGQATFKITRVISGTYLGKVTSLTHAAHTWEPMMDLNNPSQYVF